MKFAPKDGQTAGFCTTAVCISYPRREGDAPTTLCCPHCHSFWFTAKRIPVRTWFLRQQRQHIQQGQQFNITRTITDVHGRHGEWLYDWTHFKKWTQFIILWQHICTSAPRRGRRNLAQGRMSVANGTLGKTRPDGTRPTGASGNGCNGVPFGTTNNHPVRNRFESCSFLMHFAMNPICFAALEGSFARKIRISYTLKMESYTQSFTRNCQ